jgi:glycosyltransferase involved in cell wall biosynthesis
MRSDGSGIGSHAWCSSLSGFLEMPARIYPALDLYLSTSLKEGLPLSLVEAMGAGLATVATDVPGHRDVLAHGKTGLLIPADDDAALADAVVSLRADPIKRAALSKAARQWVRDEFGIDKMLDRTAAVYRAAGGSRPGGSVMPTQ